MDTSKRWGRYGSETRLQADQGGRYPGGLGSSDHWRCLFVFRWLTASAFDLQVRPNSGLHPAYPNPRLQVRRLYFLYSRAPSAEALHSPGHHDWKIWPTYLPDPSRN